MDDFGRSLVKVLFGSLSTRSRAEMNAGLSAGLERIAELSAAISIMLSAELKREQG